MDIVARAKGLITRPREEWQAIAGEPSDTAGLFKNYVAPLSVIPAVAGFIGTSLIGVSVPGLGTVRTGLGTGLASAILQFGLSLVLVYVLALVIDALAPTFQGHKNMLAAFKVAAYSMTPSWLAGIFSLIPSISFLSLLGLYAIYVLYVGLPLLMRTPANKALGYTAVVVLAAIVLSIVLAAVLGLFVGRSITL
jgi:hypothetical protein